MIFSRIVPSPTDCEEKAPLANTIPMRSWGIGDESCAESMQSWHCLNGEYHISSVHNLATCRLPGRSN